MSSNSYWLIGGTSTITSTPRAGTVNGVAELCEQVLGKPIVDVKLRKARRQLDRDLRRLLSSQAEPLSVEFRAHKFRRPWYRRKLARTKMTTAAQRAPDHVEAVADCSEVQERILDQQAAAAAEPRIEVRLLRVEPRIELEEIDVPQDALEPVIEERRVDDLDQLAHAGAAQAGVEDVIAHALLDGHPFVNSGAADQHGSGMRRAQQMRHLGAVMSDLTIDGID